MYDSEQAESFNPIWTGLLGALKCWGGGPFGPPLRNFPNIIGMDLKLGMNVNHYKRERFVKFCFDYVINFWMTSSFIPIFA